MTPIGASGRQDVGWVAGAGKALRADAVLTIVLTGLLIAPFFVFRTIPLYDLPNHIARQHILFGDGAPGAAVHYGVHWQLIPNLAMEGFVFALHPFMSVDLAVRVFLAATVGQLFLGAISLNRALFGGSGRFALAACLFAYNGPFLFGFVNLAFGIGMSLWVFALWLRWRRHAAAIPIVAALACGILMAHLFAFAVFALVACAYSAGEAWRHWRAQEPFRATARRAAVELAQLVLPVAIYLTLMPRELQDTGFDYGGLAWKAAAVTTMMGTGSPVFELPSLFALAAGAVLIGRKVKLAPGMAWPLAVLCLAFVLLPHRLGEAYFVDYRMPSTIMLFLIAGTDWRASSAAVPRRALALALALFALRFGLLMVHWSAWQPVYDAYRAAFAALPQGATLLPLRHDPEIFDPRETPPLGQIASWAVTERGAFIPNLFADMAHQLLVYEPPYDRLRTQAPRTDKADAYDYVLLIRPKELGATEVPAFRPIVSGPTFVLGRLVRP